MRRQNLDDAPYNASQAVTATFTSGAPSLGAASLSSGGMGPNLGGPGMPGQPRKKSGYFGQWVKLLGLDTFIATARGGLVRDPITGQLRAPDRRSRDNPWSQGVVINCKDFWTDPAPYFGRRTGSEALLAGEPVNYARMYDMPRRRTGGNRGMVYTSVADGDDV